MMLVRGDSVLNQYCNKIILCHYLNKKPSKNPEISKREAD